MLLGHKIGLASCYYRSTEQEMYDEYMKAVNVLTINEENRLKIKVELLSLQRDCQLASSPYDYCKDEPFVGYLKQHGIVIVNSTVSPYSNLRKFFILKFYLPINCLWVILFEKPLVKV